MPLRAAPVLPGSNILPGAVAPRATVTPALVFDPRSLGNLALWLDARYPAGFGAAPPADGTALATWTDLSGNGRDVSQGTAAQRPLFRSANPNLLTYNQATVEVGTTGFGVQVNCSFARSTAQALQGSASLLVTATAAGNTAWSFGSSSSPSADASAGVTYTAVVSSRAVSTTRAFSLTIYWLDAGKATISSTTGSSASNSASAWTQHTVTGTAPAGTAYVLVVANMGVISASEQHYFDAAHSVVGSSTTWLPPVTLPGGMPTVQFDYLDDRLDQTTTYAMSQPMSIYAVWYDMILGSDRPVIDGLSGYGSRVSMRISGSGKAYLNAGVDRSSGASPLATAGTPVVVSSIVNGASSLVRINGSTDGSGDAGANAPSRWRIGSSGDAILPLAGGVSAVLVYSGAHDNATRQRVERWLGRTYGIAVA